MPIPICRPIRKPKLRASRDCSRAPTRCCRFQCCSVWSPPPTWRKSRPPLEGKSEGRTMPDYCETLVRKHDYDRYISALFAPERVRAHFFALYAFNYEIAKIAETVHNPVAGQLRLQWWRDAVDEIYSGTRGRTEVLQALLPAVAAHRLPKPLFDAMLDDRKSVV